MSREELVDGPWEHWMECCALISSLILYYITLICLYLQCHHFESYNKQVKRIYVPLPDPNVRRLLLKNQLKGQAFKLSSMPWFHLIAIYFACD
jgi:hypothetical protein